MLIDGQVGMFLLAGIDVNVNCLIWLVYELAQKLDVQSKTREEICKTSAETTWRRLLSGGSRYEIYRPVLSWLVESVIAWVRNEGVLSWPSKASQTSKSLSWQPLAFNLTLANSPLLLASLLAWPFAEGKILNFPESLRLHSYVCPELV